MAAMSPHFVLISESRISTPKQSDLSRAGCDRNPAILALRPATRGRSGRGGRLGRRVWRFRRAVGLAGRCAWLGGDSAARSSDAGDPARLDSPRYAIWIGRVAGQPLAVGAVWRNGSDQARRFVAANRSGIAVSRSADLRAARVRRHMTTCRHPRLRFRPPNLRWRDRPVTPNRTSRPAVHGSQFDGRP